MDELAYLHLAETWETPADKTPTLHWKKHLNSTSAALLCLTIALTIINSIGPAFALIKRGDSGPEVAQIQKTLKQVGYFRGRATGFYGSITVAAVRKFQKDNNLKVDGIVGPQTLSALKIQPETTTSEAEPTISQKIDRTPEPTAASPTPESVENPNLEQEKTDPSPEATEYPDRLKDADKPTFQVPDINNQNPNISTENSEQEKPKKLVNSPEIEPRKMKLVKTIYGKISPKSIVYSGNGLFFAQNMMYNHTITVYDRNFNLVKTIPDTVKLANYGLTKFKGNYQGAPVEA
ncbi:MAG: peptidoglycan-binding protein, partial [Microcoleus sp.]